MKVWTLYNDKVKRYLTYDWNTGASMGNKVNNNTNTFSTQAEAKERHDDMVKKCREQIDYYAQQEVKTSGDHAVKRLLEQEKLLPIIEGAVPIEIPIPILFDRRKTKDVAWIDVKILSRHCTCCGVLIPQKRAVRVGRLTLCVMCINAMARSAADEVADFEKEYPDLVEIYQTERFLKAL